MQPDHLVSSAATGVDLITAERQRQVEAEHWTPEHDDHHKGQQMAVAAAVYALPPDLREHDKTWTSGGWARHYAPRWWPVGWSFKPSPADRVRELTKAGALIAAEIDRLLREAATDG